MNIHNVEEIKFELRKKGYWPGVVDLVIKSAPEDRESYVNNLMSLTDREVKDVNYLENKIRRPTEIKSITQIVNDSGLSFNTCRELLFKEWSYVKQIGEPGKWVAPIAGLTKDHTGRYVE